MHAEGSSGPEIGAVVEAEPARHRWIARVVVVAFLAAPVLLALGGTASAAELDPVDDVTDTVTDAVDPVVEQATDPVTDVVDTVNDAVDPVVEQVADTETEAVDPIVEQVADTVTEAVDPIVEQVADTVTGVIEPITEQVRAIPPGIVELPGGDDVDPPIQPPPSRGGMLPKPGSPTSAADLTDPARSRTGGVGIDGALGGTSSWTTTSLQPSSNAAGAVAIPPPSGQPWLPSISLPIGSGAAAPTGTVLVLLAGLAGTLALIRPSIRSPHAPWVVACNAAVLALSVERPG